jgi:hypothetical protein
MKKSFLIFCAATAMLCSCTTVKQTASEQDVNSQIHSGVYATMEVSSKKISYTLNTTPEIRRGGVQNCINAAIHEALKIHGDADVLVQTEKAVIERRGLFGGKKVKSVTVKGYPAKYVSFENKPQ